MKANIRTHASQALSLDPRRSTNGSAATRRPTTHAAPTRKRGPSMPSSSLGEARTMACAGRKYQGGRAPVGVGRRGSAAAPEGAIDEGGERQDDDQDSRHRDGLPDEEVGVERDRLALEGVRPSRGPAREDEEVRADDGRRGRRQDGHVEAEGVRERVRRHLVAAAHQALEPCADEGEVAGELAAHARVRVRALAPGQDGAGEGLTQADHQQKQAAQPGQLLGRAEAPAGEHREQVQQHAGDEEIRAPHVDGAHQVPVRDLADDALDRLVSVRGVGAVVDSEQDCRSAPGGAAGSR